MVQIEKQGQKTNKQTILHLVYQKKKKKKGTGIPIVAQWKQTLLESMRMQVQSLALLRGLRILCCHELRYGSHMQLRSGVAVAVV